ncbi:MAG TPA: DNA polymerase III subunit alpha [Propionibacteriaceae bacterium]|nr:DNA polymerase III subunit alpha [Propionibacteriaceae bacterium]
MNPFVHLRVASGYSLQYGASHPSALVARAAQLGFDTLGLTDRDGLYGAVRFAKACLAAGIAPVLGVDLAVPADVAPGPRRARTPVRGGQLRDARHPRVVVTARSKAGWAALCRLVSAVHLTGERGTPLATVDQIAQAAAAGDLVVQLGADSALGLAAARGRVDDATAELARWRGLLPQDALVVAPTCHDVPDGVGSELQAARLVALADDARIPVVLTNAVRMAERHQAMTTDVLDAARRLVPLDARNVDRRNAEGYLKGTDAMAEVAGRVAARAGRGAGGADRLLGRTRDLSLECALDPRADIGLGEIHLPELDVLGVAGGQVEAIRALRRRCESGMGELYPGADPGVVRRLDEELAVIEHLGFASYFLTVADVVGIVRRLGIRCAARGSGAGSLVNYLLGISGVDPIRYDLILERFLSPLRQALPDIDLDVESARRTEVYDAILATFGGERVACVAMLDTYRVRHAVRDVGAALSLPPAEVDAIAKTFPHIRARDARAALRDLPELRAAGLGEKRLNVLFDLVESLDGLPRHVALHPCGVLLSDATLLDRTPVEASFGGYPMSQFDKDDVEDIGLLKLDVLGIRMQSSFAHALEQIERTESVRVDIDALAPFDDPATYDLIAKAATLGCFQIESPGQRELVAKFSPETFADIIIDISLFRPGPVKSDMITPFLEARQGWKDPAYPHPDIEPVLAETCGVVVFHEQIIKLIAVATGCSLAQGDEARRALGDQEGQETVRRWFVPQALRRGYSPELVERLWEILASFASFGFCKAHAAAFALPTYQSAWLKAHYPAHFLAGVLTHDPGMYPKRLLLDEARRLGVTILGLDVNASEAGYRVERLGEGDALVEVAAPASAPGRRRESPPLADRRGMEARLGPGAGLPDGRPWGIWMSLADVAGISEAEVSRIVAGRPYSSLTDFWNRAGVAQPVVERLILAGGFDRTYGIGRSLPVGDRGRVTRRDLLLSLADLGRMARVDARATRARGVRAAARMPRLVSDDPRDRARLQSQATAPAGTPEVQQPLDFTTGAVDVPASGLPEMTDAERVTAELGILGIDVSDHVVSRHRRLFAALGVTPAADLLSVRSSAEVLVAGVKVATQTPGVRSGRRVIFLTLDDTTGLSDATFFEDVQGPYAATVFASWLLVVRGVMRRTGPRGRSLRATAAWDLTVLQAAWDAELDRTGSEDAALAAVEQLMAVVPTGYSLVGELLTESTPDEERGEADTQHHGRAGGMGQRRVLVHASGAMQSPYADVRPSGLSPADAPRKLWHSSPASSGR